MPFLKLRKETRPPWKIAEEKVIRNGFRIATFGETSSKDKYMGEFRNDVKHGKGIQEYEDSTIYDGDWKFGKRSGQGILSTNCGHGIRTRIYTGSWEYDKPHGFGLKNFADGGMYKGEFKCGYRHGYGCMFYPNGYIYIGKWFKDLRSGVGRYINPESGNYYEGMFKKDTKCGRGRFYHVLTGQVQDGVWLNDLGITTLMWDDAKRRATATKQSIYPIPPTQLKSPHEIFHDAAQEVMEKVRNF